MKKTNNKYVTFDKESLAQLTPDEAHELLIDGNDRFVKNEKIVRDHHDQIVKTSSGQAPFAVVLSCIDSRVPAEIIFDQGIGDIFNVRVAGNILNDDILGSMEFACNVVGSKLIFVLGHTGCGAVKGAYQGAKLGHLTDLLKKINPAIQACNRDDRRDESSHLDLIASKNVELVMEDIKAKSPLLREMIEGGKVKLAGGMYDVKNGNVNFI